MFLLARCTHTANLRGTFGCADPFCMHPVNTPLSHAVHCKVAMYGMSAILRQGAFSLCFCMQNLQPVISQLLTLSNTTEQRDGRRDTPLMLARKRGLDQVVDMLLTAGARDLPSSYPVAGCSVWAPGIYAFQSSS